MLDVARFFRDDWRGMRIMRSARAGLLPLHENLCSKMPSHENLCSEILGSWKKSVGIHSKKRILITHFQSQVLLHLKLPLLKLRAFTKRAATVESTINYENETIRYINSNLGHSGPWTFAICVCS